MLHKAFLSLLPVSAAVVVGWVVVSVAAERPLRSARVFGGGVLGAERLALRLTVVDRTRSTEAVVPGVQLRAQLAAGERSVGWEGRSDAHGSAELRFVLPRPLEAPARLQVVEVGGGTLVEGLLASTPARWAATGSRRGGWVPVVPAVLGTADVGADAGPPAFEAAPLVVSIAPARGALAVPFGDTLWIRVAGGVGSLEGARVRVRVSGGLGDTDLRLGVDGLASTRLTPLDHVVEVALVVETRAGQRFSGSRALPVAAGALHADCLPALRPTPRTHR